MAVIYRYPELYEALRNRCESTIAVESLILAILIVLSVLGNIFVCYVVYKTPRLRAVPNMFVTNLAVSDILMGAVCMPLSLGVVVSGEWLYGNVMCSVHGFFMFSFGIVSQVTMSVIAVNRFFAITRPFTYTKFFTVRNSRLIIVMLWILPSLASVPPLAGWGIYAFNPGKAFCIYPFDENMVYTTIVQVTFIAVPLGLIIFSYTKCYIAMRANARRVAHMKGQRSQQQAQQAEGSEGVMNPNPEGSARSKEARATRTMMMTTLAFTLCWTPVSIIDFVDTFTGGGQLPRQVYMLNGFLIFISSSVNPFIYGLTNRDFRKSYFEALPCFGNPASILGDHSMGPSASNTHCRPTTRVVSELSPDSRTI